MTEMLKSVASCFCVKFWYFCRVLWLFITHIDTCSYSCSLSLSLSFSLSLSLSPSPLTALRCLYDHTVASCIYSACRYFRSNDGLKRMESSTSVEDMEVSEMKEKLKFHFMNPFQKWRYEPRRRFPWKLIVQLTSMFLVTLQVGIWMWMCERGERERERER